MATSPIVTSLDLAFLCILVRCCPMSDGNYSANPCIPMTVVLDACAIITGNYNGNGHLFCDREGKSPVPSSLLEAGEYFYVIDDYPSFNYPLFASFDVWVPPPRSDVPDHWFSPQCPKKQDLYPVTPVRWTDIDATNPSAGICGPSKVPTLSPWIMVFGHVCYINLHAFITDIAQYTTHQVPEQLRYPNIYPHTLSGPHFVHDIRNFLTLRVDIYQRWDKHTFFFVPFNGSLVLYFIGPLPDLYSIQYHFGKPNLPERVDPYLLFIRFALAIFTLLFTLIIICTLYFKYKVIKRLAHPKQYKVPLKGSGTLEEQGDVVEEGGYGDNVSESAEFEELGDGPRLLVKIYEDNGWELPPDLAAAFIPRDEKIEAAKLAWFEANPQICQRSEATTGVASEIPFE
ncbi:unnamed protein product [Cyclocybe aegerita]|uniref:HNH nuclease domain-containing protein n=1 Tax=Cyclocybe aegerita TaxID=1973307 RepID=A0A8S0WDA1_CYCAE|nr:unnamed protein product [Cyclocybe aegerita]